MKRSILVCCFGCLILFVSVAAFGGDCASCNTTLGCQVGSAWCANCCVFNPNTHTCSGCRCTRSCISATATIDIATGHAWATSTDLVSQIAKEDAVVAKAVLGGQSYIVQHPKVCDPQIQIKVLTPFGDATGSFDAVKEKLSMRIPTGKTTFKMVTLSIEGGFWSLNKDGVTESTGTFDATK